MSKTLSPLEQVLVDTIQKASNVTGEVYDAARGVTTKAIDFASTQIPDVIHQLLVWKLAEALTWMGLGLVIIGLFVWVRSRIARWVKDDRARYRGDIDALHTFTVMGGCATFCVSGLLIFCSLLDVLKIWLAPKIFLIEYVSHLIR